MQNVSILSHIHNFIPCGLAVSDATTIVMLKIVTIVTLLHTRSNIPSPGVSRVFPSTRAQIENLLSISPHATVNQKHFIEQMLRLSAVCQHYYYFISNIEFSAEGECRTLSGKIVASKSRDSVGRYFFFTLNNNNKRSS